MHQNDTVTVTIDDAKRIFYNDMPDAEAEAWAKKLNTWSNYARFGKSTYAGWRFIPTTYVLCSRDAGPFGKWGKPMLDAAKAEKPCAIDVTEEINTGHCPMISDPKEVAAVLQRAAVA